MKERLRKLKKWAKCVNAYFPANSSDMIFRIKFKKIIHKTENEKMNCATEYKCSRAILNIGAEKVYGLYKKVRVREFKVH